ncbi:hypothetical protein [Conexibacter arvalis]|uniref:Septum formation-related domain-containing protein n=1 Tax=Conexibacter arvalis TaxID=912552 RepID=A0A840IA71_9ACTN|nr:hypothetical protein [Conexibacter arvalis]MBB4661255.1 hypothetical protein [Conexibacter arvalis]
MPALSATRRRLALMLALVLIVAGAVAVAAVGGDDAPATVVKDAHFIDADEPGVLTFENGDCFRDPEKNRAHGEEILNTVECVGADNEVFAFLTLPDGPWDAAAVEREGVAGCERAFGELWGEPGSGPARLDVYPVLPTERSWTGDGDRNVMCVVWSHLGEFTADPISQRAQR